MFNTIQPGHHHSSPLQDTHDARQKSVTDAKGIDKVEETGVKPPVTDFNVDVVVDNILSFVRQKIASAPEDQQQSLLEQAKEGVLKGFSEAGVMLEDMGRMNPDFKEGMDTALSVLDERMQSVTSLMAPKESANEQMISEAKSAREQRLEMFAANSQSLSMSVTTRDGDRINLKYSAASMQEATSMSNKYGYIYQWASMENTNISMVVDGDLDVDEREALNSLLKSVDKLATEFFDGDLDIAFKMAQDLELDFSELASLNLNLKEVDVASVKSYGQISADNDKGHHVPKGLAPLVQYAKDMVAAAEDLNQKEKFWPQQLMDLLDIHPLVADKHKAAQQSIFARLM